MLKQVQLYDATEYAVARRQDALATLEMTRQVKKVGVITRSEAFHYVDQLRASDVRDDLLQIGAGGKCHGNSMQLRACLSDPAGPQP